MHSCLYSDSTIVISNLFSCQLIALVGSFASDCSFEMLVLIGGDWVLASWVWGEQKFLNFRGEVEKNLCLSLCILDIVPITCFQCLNK